MALTAYLVVLFHLCRSVSSAPFDTIPTDATTEAPVPVTQIVTSNIEVIETSTIILQTTPPAVVPPVPPALSTISPVPQTTLPAQQEASTISPTPQPVTNVVTVIATSTPPPVTVTVSIPPATVTQTVVTTLPSSTIPSSSSIASAQTAWTAPAQMTDLASFNISYFPYGQDNVAIVNGTTTANASADNLSLAAAAAGTANTESSNSSAPPQPMMNGTDAALQLFYPAGSINPESEPQGGADFYASPIDLSKANNVTLEYSVYFPADFDWVLAGKLPGLYGGHSGCSGGNDARSCFSTRLMWRAKGAGELYLYAPKDKQTKELCSAPPQSVCDQEYGLSVGRGSFNFTPGAWTHVRQTVTLNTPGGQDGGFVLEVNGQEVMRRADVFYRGVDTTSEPSDDDGDDDDDGLDEDEPGNSDDGSGGDEDDGGDEDGDGDGDDESPAPQQPSSSPAPPQPAPLVDPGAVPILGPLLNGLRFRVMGSPHYIDIASGENVSHLLTLQARDDSVPLWLSGASSPAFILSSVDQNTTAVSVTPSVVSITTTSVVAMEALTQTMSVQATTTAVIYADASQSVPSGSFVAEAESTLKPVGFSGSMYSSFFGGHEEKYASPRDQYTWFKDFALTVNG